MVKRKPDPLDKLSTCAWVFLNKHIAFPMWFGLSSRSLKIGFGLVLENSFRFEYFQKTLLSCLCIYRKLSLLFVTVFFVRRFVYATLSSEQQQINGTYIQNSATCNLSNRTCVWINVHLPSDYIEDERRQMAFPYVL